MLSRNKFIRLLAASVSICALTSAQAQQIGFPGIGGTGGGGSGTVTQINTTCAVAGGPITNTGTITGALIPNDVATGSAYPFVATDCGKLIRFTDSVARAPTLNVALFAQGNYINIKNDGTATQTITPSAGTINGAASFPVIAGASYSIAYDATNTNWIVSGTYILGPSSATTGDVPTFSDTTGQKLGDSGKTLPTGAVVGTSDSQTLTNKLIDGSEITSGAVALARIAALAANQLLGSLTAVAPSGLSVPSCSGASNALTWTSGAGFGCNTISGGSGDGSLSAVSPWLKNPLDNGIAVTGNVGVANEYMCGPFKLKLTQTYTVKALALRVIASSTGNSSVALQGALYNDAVVGGAGAAGTTSCGTSGASCHRPGTLIDYADGGGGFATGAAATVQSTMHNTTDSIVGPATIWFCTQKFDGVATFAAMSNTGNLVAAELGAALPTNLIGTSMIDGIQTTGTGFGGVNWINFTGSTAWVEGPGQGLGASALLQVN